MAYGRPKWLVSGVRRLIADSVIKCTLTVEINILMITVFEVEARYSH